jgi:hypothetical protein
LADSAAGADVVSFLGTLESELPAAPTSFQIAVISLIEGLSAFSDLWCAFFCDSPFFRNGILNTCQSTLSEDNVELRLVAVRALGQMWVYELGRTSTTIWGMVETVLNLPLDEESFAAGVIKLLGKLLPQLDLDQITLSSIAELLLHALNFPSARIVKVVSRAAIQILKRDSAHAHFIADHEFFAILIGQVNNPIDLPAQQVSPDIFMLISQLLMILDWLPSVLVNMLQAIEADSYHRILIAGPLPTAVACLEVVIFFVLWNDEAVDFFSESDRFMQLTWDFDDPALSASMGAVWLRFCDALMLRNGSQVVDLLLLDGTIGRTSKFLEADDDTPGYYVHLVFSMIDESLARGCENEVAEAILNVDGLFKQIETLQECELTFLIPALSLSIPISAMANRIIEFLRPIGDDSSEAGDN